MKDPFTTHKDPMAWWWVLLLDIAALGAALVIFAFFHHVLPRQGEAQMDILSAEELIATPAPPARTPVLSDAAPVSAPAPTPTPAPGDFSATFPTEDTGADAAYSYQTDAIRIAVRQVRQEKLTYYVADIWLRSIADFKTAFAQDQYGQGIQDRPEVIAKAHNAILAVSGDYYGARAKGIVIRNGKLYRDVAWRDVCVLYADGVMETYAKDAFDLDAAIARKAYQAWCFGPRLLENGQARTEFGADEKLSKKNPRCGVGYYAPGHYCLVLVDGRQGSYSQGLTLDEFSQLFYDLGCVSAYNLDGGKTAMMVFRGETVNQPFEGGRRVSDIVYIGEETA